SRCAARLSHVVGRVPRSPPGDVRAVDDAGRAALADQSHAFWRRCRKGLGRFRPEDQIAVQFFASCPPGVADLTAAELRACGATNTRELKLGVLFEGTLETAYRACLWSRTASRILMPLGNFPAATPEELYAGVAGIDWAQHLAPSGTLAIEFGGSSAGIKHTH